MLSELHMRLKYGEQNSEIHSPFTAQSNMALTEREGERESADRPHSGLKI